MDHDEIQAFGEALGIFRTRVGISQQKLADQLGVSRRTVAAWEAGEYLPKTKGVVLQIARFLKLNDEETLTLLKTAGVDPSPTLWHVPYAQNPLFTGREDVLRHLEVLLPPESAAASVPPQALNGLGGIGKTLTAVEYAYRHRQAYSAVLWLQANSWDILSSEIVKLARVLCLPERDDQDQTRVIEAVRRWLKVHRRWLLILDDAEDLQMIQKFLPAGHSGSVLLTTRAQVTGPLIQARPVSIMNEQEGVLFLLRRTEYLPHETPLEQATREHYHDARQIWRHMEGLPLALDQAGAYILETGCSFSDYIAIYQNQRSLLLQSRGNLFTLEHPLSVTSTFLLSAQKIEQMNPIAIELLRTCAFLYAEAIPEDVILEGAMHLGPHLTSIAKDLNVWNQAIAILRAYSLVRRDGERRILSVHRLVQTVMKDEMDESTQKQWAERVVRVIAQQFPFSEVVTWASCERLLPHALVCSNSIMHWGITLPEAAVLLNNAGKYLYDLAQYAMAESFVQHALSICEQIFEPEHGYIADSLNLLGILSRAQGKYEVAESLFQRALTLNKHRSDHDTLSAAFVLNNLALLYNDQGLYEKAEPLYQQVLAIYEHLLEPDHPNIALLLNNLAVLYADQERYEEAEPLYQRALTIREQVLGAEHPDIAQSLSNVANLYRAQNKHEMAETFHRRALELRVRILGHEHPDTADSLNNLGALLLNQGKYNEAEAFIHQALHIRKQLLGSEHFDTAISTFNSASISLFQGEDENAERLYQQALSTFERLLRPDHSVTVGCQRMLFLLYHIQEQNDKIEALHKRTLAIREQILGLHHPGVATSLNALAVYYILQERYEEAEALFQRALTIRAKEFGADHPSTVQSFHNLVSLYDIQGRHAEVLLLFEQAPVSVQAFHELATFYEAMGRHEEAASLRATGERVPRSGEPG